jgi:hypothetical protein
MLVLKLRQNKQPKLNQHRQPKRTTMIARGEFSEDFPHLLCFFVF